MHLSEPRSVARRIGERLALAAVVLVLAGVGLWMVEGRRGETTDPSLHGAAESLTGGVGRGRCQGAAADLALAGNVLRAAADALVRAAARADAPRR